MCRGLLAFKALAEAQDPEAVTSFDPQTLHFYRAHRDKINDLDKLLRLQIQ